jgi:hypothetical protein
MLGALIVLRFDYTSLSAISILFGIAAAAVFSFFLIFAGTFDIITSISARHEIEVMMAAADRRHHRAGARLLGGRLLRSQRHSPRRLGGRHRSDPRRQQRRARLSRARDPASGFGLRS